MNTAERVKMIGVYPLAEEEQVYLIEMLIDDSPSKVNFDMFLLKDDRLPKADWQAVYDEWYLNDDGTAVVGDYFTRSTIPEDKTRVVFSMFLEKMGLPLSTPYGDIPLCAVERMPPRLKAIIPYSPMD